MGEGVLSNVFYLLGGMAVMLFGMHVMGNNLERVAGNNLKKLLGKMTSNRFAGVGVGATMTVIMQSSAATTVMLVGFVNVGLMTCSGDLGHNGREHRYHRYGAVPFAYRRRVRRGVLRVYNSGGGRGHGAFYDQRQSE